MPLSEPLDFFSLQNLLTTQSLARNKRICLTLNHAKECYVESKGVNLDQTNVEFSEAIT